VGLTARPVSQKDPELDWLKLAAGSSIDTATFVPPPPNEMEAAFSELERYVDSSRDNAAALPLLVDCALVHAQFETIHPYLDGNGRMGRLLITLLSANAECSPHPSSTSAPTFVVTGRSTSSYSWRSGITVRGKHGSTFSCAASVRLPPRRRRRLRRCTRCARPTGSPLR